MVTTFRYSAKSQRDARLHGHHARLTGKTPNRSFKFKGACAVLSEFQFLEASPTSSAAF